MSIQEIKNDLMTDLSTEEQQVVSGGNWYSRGFGFGRGYGYGFGRSFGFVRGFGFGRGFRRFGFGWY